MRKLLPSLSIIFCLFCSSIATTAQTNDIPAWVIADWEKRAQGEGTWVADNSAYQSETEPFEAYGLKWSWGLGQKSLTGRLYCIQDGRDVWTAWTFLEYWDPETKELKLIQNGSDGTVGKGTIWQEADGATRSLQTFVNPDGSSSVSGHQSAMVNGDSHVSSFEVKGETWTPRRSYIWKNTNTKWAGVPTPEVYKDFEFLIGTWQVDLGKERIVDMTFEWAQNKMMIHYKSGNPRQPGQPFQYEVKGVIAYHGVKEQLVFMSAYLDSPPTLMNEGRFEFPKPGVIERIFTVFYKEGSGIPWSNGEKAPKGGKPVNFKQVWTKVDEDTFIGEFFWEKDGQWSHPYAAKGKEKETWRRVK